MKAFITATSTFGAQGRGRENVTPGSVPDQALAGGLTMRGLRPLSRTARLAMVVAAQVFPPGSPTRDDDGVVLGSAWSSVGPLAAFVQVAAEHGPDQVFPMAFPNTVVSVHAGYVAALLGCRGPALSVCGEHAGFESLIEALSLLEHRRAERVLAIAAEAAESVVTAARPSAGEAAAALRIAATPEAECVSVVTGVWAAPCPKGLPLDVRRDALDADDPQALDLGAVSGMLSVLRGLDEVTASGRPVVVLGRSGVRGVAAVRIEQV